MRKRNRTVEPDQEPIGIVISRGNQPAMTPTVFAYVWAPAPAPAPDVADEAKQARVA